MQTLDHTHGNADDHEYDAYLLRLQARFNANTQDGTRPVFTTDAPALWERYLSAFPDHERQHHNCHACRRFIETYGGLVTIEPEGLLRPLLWSYNDAPPRYQASVDAMGGGVFRAKVTGIFHSSERTWGNPKTGVWTHLSVRPPSDMVWRSVTQTAGQRMAERREDFNTVSRALAEFQPQHVAEALRVLRSDVLYRSEKLLGQAEWLAARHDERASTKNARTKANLLWLAIGTAPAGFCHPRSSMIGTLLEDIAAGKGFAELSRAFAAKMHPLRYQRPQAAPRAGAIAQGEKIVAQLGAQGSLARRFARLEDIQALWKPAPQQPPTATGGVFGQLRPKDAAPQTKALVLPTRTMTWVRFAREVLPSAERIEFYAASVGNYCALTTAVHADAPPILQWDTDTARNPVAWYVWAGGTSPSHWGLEPGYVDVDAVALKPSMWGNAHEHQGKGVVFVLRGARESRKGGLGLFPETLRSEFHGVRSVIEAYSRSGELEGFREPHAAGYLAGVTSWDVTVRVTSKGNADTYRIDRWE